MTKLCPKWVHRCDFNQNFDIVRLYEIGVLIYNVCNKICCYIDIVVIRQKYFFIKQCH
jgi:hypothetical protein